MQTEFYRLRARQQIHLRPPQRRRRRRFRRAHGRQDHELRRIPALPKAGQDIHRRRVRPLEIFDPQHQRAGVRERLQGRDHLTQHPRRRRYLRSRAREQRRVGIIRISAGRSGSQLGACRARVAVTVPSSVERARRESRSTSG